MSSFIQSNICYGVNFGDNGDVLTTSAMLKYTGEYRIKHKYDAPISVITTGSEGIEGSYILGIDLACSYLEDGEDVINIDFAEMNSFIDKHKSELLRLVHDSCEELGLDAPEEPRVYLSTYQY